MNERILELANELGPIATIGNWGRVEWKDNVYPQLGDKLYAAIDLQKFAALIVRECAKRSLELGQPEIGLGLIKHFGVEESKGWVCPKCGTDRIKAVCPQGPSAAVDGRCPMIASAQ